MSRVANNCHLLRVHWNRKKKRSVRTFLYLHRGDDKRRRRRCIKQRIIFIRTKTFQSRDSRMAKNYNFIPKNIQRFETANSIFRLNIFTIIITLYTRDLVCDPHIIRIVENFLKNIHTRWSIKIPIWNLYKSRSERGRIFFRRNYYILRKMLCISNPDSILNLYSVYSLLQYTDKWNVEPVSIHRRINNNYTNIPTIFYFVFFFFFDIMTKYSVKLFENKIFDVRV